MLLASARALKESLQDVIARAVSPGRRAPPPARCIPKALLDHLPSVPLALGITGRGEDAYRLAVRIQTLVPGLEALLAVLRRHARGEIDVRLVGRIVKQGTPWNRRRNRPLRIGSSVGHVTVSAGTLGCFVAPRTGGDGVDRILSNNHVLAGENRGRRGDAIVQPGAADGGQAPADRVATLDRFVAIEGSRRNTVDAATAVLADGVEYYCSELAGRGELRGPRARPLVIGERVYKVGRTTGLTAGRISAIEVDGVLVAYETGTYAFDDQVEIEPAGSGESFSRGGDSGSIIVDARGRAVGLLFAGNDVDTTYANPIGAVFEALDVKLAEA